MGVPSFFRWLCRRYPRIVQDVIESKHEVVEGVEVPVDTSAPNPNGVEFDNLYLDMNGIIHPCAHPETGPPPKDEDEMLQNVGKYVDRIFGMVRPRRLLFLAIDGVAPRAKMNQQRSRRFRAAQERKMKHEKEVEMRQKWLAEGKDVAAARPPSWDHNVITPGTPFMERVSLFLQHFIRQRLTSDPGWKNITVIFSDARMPGEGEHKIMAFIRQQRAQPNYNPNLRHCLYGMDADLIMLALATHEAHFSIIRETVLPPNQRSCDICGQKGHTAGECEGKASEEFNMGVEKLMIQTRPFQFLNVPILREYLRADLHVDNLPFQWDFERAIDDWVLLCFFVGNDFLPHLPSLSIAEGAIDLLVKIYKETLATLGGFLTSHGGRINAQRANRILEILGLYEADIFRKRYNRKERFRRMDEAAERRKVQQRTRSGGLYTAPAEVNLRLCAPTPATKPEAVQANLAAAAALKAKLRKRKKPSGEESGSQKKRRLDVEGSAAEIQEKEECAVKEEIAVKEDAVKEEEGNAMKDGESAEEESEKERAAAEVKEAIREQREADEKEKEKERIAFKAKLDGAFEEMNKVEGQKDAIRLHERGWKARYYMEKMKLDLNNEEDRKQLNKLLHAYFEGLCWVMLYYYEGCPSWSWYYPFHYAPMASDLRNLHRYNITFEPGTPFSPLAQLMGVLPAASQHCLPKVYGKLMSQPDSPIIDFYPEEFELDMNGKRWAWQAVCLLPFIDEKRLLDTLKKYEGALTDAEKKRNSVGADLVFVNVSHAAANTLFALNSLANAEDVLDPNETEGLFGRVRADPDAVLPNMPARCTAVRNVEPIKAVQCCTAQLLPPPTLPHRSVILPGAELPPSVLNERDFALLQSRRKPRFYPSQPYAEQARMQEPRSARPYGQSSFHHERVPNSDFYRGTQQFHSRTRTAPPSRRGSPPPHRQRCPHPVSRGPPPASRRGRWGPLRAGGVGWPPFPVPQRGANRQWQAPPPSWQAPHPLTRLQRTAPSRGHRYGPPQRPVWRNNTPRESQDKTHFRYTR